MNNEQRRRIPDRPERHSPASSPKCFCLAWQLRSSSRIPRLPYFLNAWNLSDATLNFTEKALIAFAMTLLIISGEQSIFRSPRSLRSPRRRWGSGAGRCRHTRPRDDRHRHRSCLWWRDQWRAGCRVETAVHRRDHRHDEPLPAAFPIVLGRSGLGGYPASFAYFGQGYVFWVISSNSRCWCCSPRCLAYC